MLIFQTGSKQAKNGTFSFQSGNEAVKNDLQTGEKCYFPCLAG